MESSSGGGSDPRGLPERVGGKYLTVRAIASGGMGAVYEVEHEGTGERLALKVLKGSFDGMDSTALERFRREARVHALLKSEHIVRVIDADVAPELGGAPYLVMDLLEGQTLGDLAGDEPLPAARVVELLSQLAGPLDQAHAAGIVHRDLKPDNLFLTRRADGSEVVKILDFGIAKFRGGDDTARTSTGALVGTPLFMAREQAAGEHDLIGPGTDVWSIAMIAFRLLTGTHYWTSNNVSLLLADIVSKPVKAPSRRAPRLGDKFDAWFLRSCAPVPGERWQSVTEQVEALARALGVREPQSASRHRIESTLPASSRSGIAEAPPASQSLAGSVASAAADTARPRRASFAFVGGAAALLAVGVFFALKNRQAEVTPPPVPSGARVPEPQPVLTPARPLPTPAACAQTEKNTPPSVAPSARAPDAGVRKSVAGRRAPAPSPPAPDPLAEPK